VVLVEASTVRMSCPSVVSPNPDNMAVALGDGHLSLQVLVTQAQVRTAGSWDGWLKVAVQAHVTCCSLTACDRWPPRVGSHAGVGCTSMVCLQSNNRVFDAGLCDSIKQFNHRHM
jgi:hypothetical protein